MVHRLMKKMFNVTYHWGNAIKITMRYYLTHARMKVKVWLFSHVWLFATPWTVARQASLSMELSRQEYWSGLQLPSPRDLPDPEIKPGPHALQADSFLSEPWGWLSSQRQQITSGERGAFMHCWWVVNSCSHLENSIAFP